MNEQEIRMVELLASNRAAISKISKLESSIDIAVAALVWTLADRAVNPEQMRASSDYLRSKTGALSSERTVNRLTLVSRMALSGDNAVYLAEVQRIFAKIMEGKKLETNSRYGTALLIANCTSTPEEADQLLERARRIFERMRETHPVITDDRDMTFATIVALSERDDDELLEDAEECYQLLGKTYKLTEGRQSMAHVLALSSLSPAEKVARLDELRAAFKARKVSIGWTSSQEYTMLALLALEDRSADEIAADVAELDAVIRKQKGFGTFSIGSAIRLMLAATISIYTHQDAKQVGAVTDAITFAVIQALIDWFIYLLVFTIV